MDLHKAIRMHPWSKHRNLLDRMIFRQKDRCGEELSTEHRLVIPKMVLVVRPSIRKRPGVKKLCVNKPQDNSTGTYTMRGCENPSARKVPPV